MGYRFGQSITPTMTRPDDLAKRAAALRPSPTPTMTPGIRPAVIQPRFIPASPPPTTPGPITVTRPPPPPPVTPPPLPEAPLAVPQTPPTTAPEILPDTPQPYNPPQTSDDLFNEMVDTEIESEPSYPKEEYHASTDVDVKETWWEQAARIAEKLSRGDSSVFAESPLDRFFKMNGSDRIYRDPAPNRQRQDLSQMRMGNHRDMHHFEPQSGLTENRGRYEQRLESVDGDRIDYGQMRINMRVI